MADYLLGIDIGSYESKGVLTDTQGRIAAQHIIKHQLEFQGGGRVEHDAEAIWWGEFCEIARTLAAKVDPAEIRGVGVSCVFSMLPIDADNDPLRPGGILYGVDTRSEAEIEAVNTRFGEDAIFESSGNTISTQSMGPKIEWLKNHEPEVHRKAAAFLHGASFIVARLTGERVMSHYDAAFYAPLYDLSAQRWNAEMCEGICALEQLPALKWTSEIAGRITGAGAAATGLVEGTPVTTGVSDAGAEALSIGVVAPGSTMLMYGSAAWLTLITDSPLRDRSLWSSPYLFKGTFCLHAGILVSGSLTRWMRDLMGRDIVQADGSGGDEAYQVISAEAAAIPPGSDGVVVLPYFAGAASPIHNPKARGIIFGLELGHTRGHLYRAALEGVSCAVAHCLDEMRKAGARIEKLVAVGGGTKNPTWLQATSDIAQLPQVICATTIGASYGDAFLAGLATGLIKDRGAIGDWITIGGTVAPNGDNRATYYALQQKYRELYEQTTALL
ncbi:MAG: FGGY-family carbohydrate kinase [Albidovulum sp.]|nr:FGGY-family carbohydrate kinase [Albidovulum sp.]